jgi:anti-sigma-K factor RskA
MTMTDSIAEPDVAAAELALGLLEGDERAAALRRLLADPVFAREVERWRAHFGALFAVVPEVAPAPDLGDRVIARLDGPAPAKAGYWKPVAIAASLAAAGLSGLMLVRPEPALPPPVTNATPAPMVAAFMIEGHKAPIVATYDSRAGRLSMPGPMPGRMAIPAGKSAQLWAIIGTDAPHPLGLFHRAGDRMEADAKSATPMPAGTTFAISIEPLGGSPTGTPTGPVVGSATLIRA